MLYLAAASAPIGILCAVPHLLQIFAAGPYLAVDFTSVFGVAAAGWHRAEPRVVSSHRDVIVLPVEAGGARQVVEVLSKDVEAELAVVLGAQDVGVPHLVDERATWWSEWG